MTAHLKLLHRYEPREGTSWGAFESVSWSPDGHRLALVAFNGGVRVVTPAGDLVWTGIDQGRGVECVAWSPDGSVIASGSRDGTIALWDPRDGRAVGRLVAARSPVPEARLEDCVRQVRRLAWSPDGRTLASAEWGGTARLWDPRTAREIRTIAGQPGGMTMGLCWSPSSRVIALAGERGAVCLWEVATGDRVRCLVEHQEQVVSLAWSPDGRRIASGSGDSTLRLWDPRLGRRVAVLGNPRVGLTGPRVAWCVDWSPDGRTIVSGAGDSTVRVWDPATGRETASLRGHRDWVRDLAWSPDGRLLASVDGGSELLVWAAERPATAVIGRRQRRICRSGLDRGAG